MEYTDHQEEARATYSPILMQAEVDEEQESPEKAFVLYKQALVLIEELSQANPNETIYKSDLANVLLKIAFFEVMSGRAKVGYQLLERAQTLLTDLYAADRSREHKEKLSEAEFALKRLKSII